MRVCVRLIVGVVALLGLWPADAYAQRYAYLVRDCLTTCTGQQLLVFDATTGAAVTQVQLAVDAGGQSVSIPGSKELAISPDGRRAYVTFDQRIVVVDLTTHTVTGQFGGALSPTAPVVSADGQRLYVLDHTADNSDRVLVFNTVTGVAVGGYPLSGITSPSQLAVTADGSTAVVLSSTGITVRPFASGGVQTSAISDLVDVVVHPDNLRAYVLNSSGGIGEIELSSLTETRSVVLSSLTTPTQSLSIAPDGSSLYAGVSGNTLFSGLTRVVDTVSMTAAGNLPGGAFVRASPTGLQLMAIGNSTGTSFSQVVSIVSTTGQSTLSLGSYVRTAQLIKDAAIGPNVSCVMDPPSPSSASVSATAATGSISVPAPTGCAWTATSSQSFVTITAGQSGNIAGTVTYSVAPNFLTAARSATITIAGQVFTLTQSANSGVMGASPSALRFLARREIDTLPQLTTAAQPVTVMFTGSTGVAWTATASESWVQIVGGSGTGAGQFTVGMNERSFRSLTGTQTATITLQAPSLGATFAVAVTLVIDPAPGFGAAPFGVVDTPLQDVTGVQGAISMTGWALDDMEVRQVRIYRNCASFELGRPHCVPLHGHAHLGYVVPVGDATFVYGARPDVEALYPDYPVANRAGWGFMILSNMLPNIPASENNGGVGSFTFHALAFGGYEPFGTPIGRAVGDQTGTRVTVANNTIAKPFGAIDTPTQGQTVSGTLNNFGWAITPDPGSSVQIPTNGSTVNVFIDGAPVGTAQYNLCRGSVAVGGMAPAGVLCDDDVSAAFRGAGTLFRNLDAGRGPIGLRSIDTTTLSNGQHTISWAVTDSANRSEGIGSRYFTVLNGSGDFSLRSAGASAPADRHGLKPVPYEDTDPGTPVFARIGFDLQSAFTPLVPNADGVPQVRIPELGRVELQIPGVESGALIVDGESRALPIGVGIDRDRGLVTWAPGPAYLGTYRLRFGSTLVDVTIAPTTDAPVRMHLDAAHPVLEGWALDPQSASGAGIGAVHVWARQGAAAPVFLGVADIHLPRPDVAAAHGAQFPDAGFRFTATLPAGEWEVTAYVWVTRTGRFEDARSMRVVIK